MNYHRFFCVFLVFSLVLPVFAAAAEDENQPVGSITEVSGAVSVTRDESRQIEACQGLVLFPGDMVTTGEDGVVGFQFTNGDRFKLHSDSQVSIDELSASDEDNPPMMRLALGYLWSKIQALSAGNRDIVQTPTAVIGIRGTEFDTVVAADSHAAVAVDLGAVVVEAEKQSLVVEQGLSTEIDIDEKIASPRRAVPKAQRDWQQFRRQRMQLLIQNLAQQAPKIRRRFERDVNRFTQFSRRIHEQANQIDSHMIQLQAAWKKNDRKAVRTQLQKIKTAENKFRPMVAKFRKVANRMQTIGRNTFHLRNAYQKNRSRFKLAERDVIEPELAVVSQKLGQLKISSRSTIVRIKKTYRQLKQIQGAIQKKRPAPGQSKGRPAK